MPSKPLHSTDRVDKYLGERVGIHDDTGTRSDREHPADVCQRERRRLNMGGFPFDRPTEVP